MPQDKQNASRAHEDGTATFVRRLIIAILIIGVALLVWDLRHVVALTFAAVLVAAVLVAAAGLLQRAVPIGGHWAVLAATVLILLVVALLAWLGWTQLQAQAANLLDQLSASIDKLQAQTGIPIPDSLQSLTRSSRSDGSVLGRMLGGLLSTAQAVLSHLAIFILVVIAGFFLAVDPRPYRDGLLLLVPAAQRDHARDALDKTGHGIKLWIFAQIIAMTVVGVLVGLGSWAIGLPSPLALGMVFFVAEFVPLIGPFVGAVPGILLALAAGWSTVLWTVLLYLAVQQLESNVIQPILQKQVVSVPPALLMLSVVAMGELLGVLGIVLAGPLTVSVFVLVRTLYVQDTLGEEIDDSRGI